MKLTVEIDPGAAEEILIRAKEVTPRIKRLQDAISEALSGAEELAVKSGDAECFLPFSRFLFAIRSGYTPPPTSISAPCG